ncbi:DUF1641 domain-containing protein [Bacillus sp. mrc49]|uniref:DUF1641 domain-containing protein n=2 Tax=Bacillus sp. mrc49 TaxID=2054913 RepID=UPI000C28041E|nr:DUF1641 domain-containing protein [Bacillus sp. mrc49]PJN88264.1 hypothetical protein CVN76_21405 [Bacillus sp. mrc49]PJN90343.1 hypothetical protein CVN76_10745 [Bacillus sp. mrc49]
MAKPITKIEEPVFTEKEKQSQELDNVLQDISRNSDGIKETIKLLQELHDSGILGAINNLVEAKEDVAKIAVGQMLRPPVTNALNNAMAAAGVLTELDPETTQKLVGGLSKGLQRAEEGIQSNKKVGVFDLVKLLRDPDVNRVMRFTIDLLKGLGEGLKK